MSNDLLEKTTKNKDLSTKLTSVELERNEIQKKYDDTKVRYFKIRDERDKLKGELEKSKSAECSEGNQPQTD